MTKMSQMCENIEQNKTELISAFCLFLGALGGLGGVVEVGGCVVR